MVGGRSIVAGQVVTPIERYPEVRMPCRAEGRLGMNVGGPNTQANYHEGSSGGCSTGRIAR